jgi:glycosyltransferase involved in cell wall biosynthesis
MSSVLKILHVIPSYFPAIQFGGPIQSVHLLNRSLVEQGVQVNVFTTNAGLENQKGYQSERWQELGGVKVKYFPYFGYVHYNFSVSLLKALFKSVKEYDLVHITAVWNFPVLAASLACRLHGVPYVISPRGTIYPETIALGSTFFKKLYYRLFARSCLNHAKAIHYTAHDEHQKVSQYLRLKPAVWIIPNGVDLKALQSTNDMNLRQQSSKLPSDAPYLLFLGRISRKKGLDILIKAFGLLAASHPNLLLVVAGPDEEGYLQEVVRLIEGEGLQNRVVITGLLRGEEKIEAYRRAKLFVLSSYSENFGMSVVEAMACGTPVVISDQVGIYQDIERHQAGIVTRTTPESVAAGMQELLTNPDLCARVSTRGLQLVQSHYDIDAIARSFINSYQML